MKKVLVVFVMLITTLTVFSQSTHFSVENENMMINNGSKYVHVIDIYATHDFTKKLGMFAWLLVGQSWSESYVGILYSPTSWVQMSIGAGLETNKNPLRVEGMVLLTHKKGFAFFLYENGGSGSMYRGVVNHKLNSHYGLGLMTQKKMGSGLRMQIDLNKNIQFWFAVLYSKKRTVNGFLSVKLHF